MGLRPDAGVAVSPGYFVSQPVTRPEPEHHHAVVPIDPAAFDDPDFTMWLVLHLPHDARLVPLGELVDDEFHPTGTLVHTSEHRAVLRFDHDEGTVRIAQDPRRLGDTVEAAWHAWCRHDRPGRHRVGLTARADGVQRAWLDSPQSEINWPLPGAIETSQ